METIPARSAVLAAPRPTRRPDPVLMAAALLLVGIVLWALVPLANGASTSSDLRIDINVPSATSVTPTPGVTRGDTAVQLPDLTAPGQTLDVNSSGWSMTTNWVNGYEVQIRSTTDPALRGRNAIDRGSAKSDFDDFTLGSCPCTWTTSGFDRAVFGYSATVTAGAADPAATDTAKWGSSGSRKWRGFSKSGYRLFGTPGGAGTYSWTLHLRTALAADKTQNAGTYRSTLIQSFYPVI